MTDNATEAAKAKRRDEVIAELQSVTAEMTTARDGLSKLTERRRQLILEAYNDLDLDTVQLGRIIGTSAETVRKNLDSKGGLRNPGPEQG